MRFVIDIVDVCRLMVAHCSLLVGLLKPCSPSVCDVNSQIHLRAAVSLLCGKLGRPGSKSKIVFAGFKNTERVKLRNG